MVDLPNGESPPPSRTLTGGGLRRSAVMAGRFAPMSPASARCGGFTLIEILTVVAILAVLAAILVPAATGYVQRGHAAKSMAQQRQIAAAILSQAGDNNGRVQGYVGGASVNAGEFWNAALVFGAGRTLTTLMLTNGNTANMLGPLPDPRVFFCPAFRNADPIFNYPVTRDWIWSGYGIAAFYPEGQPGSIVSGTNASGARISGVDFRLTSVAQPSRQVLLADSFSTGWGGRQSFRIQANLATEGIHLRHAGRAHVMFLDGHGEALDAAALRTLTANRVTLFDDQQQPIP